LPSKSDDKKPYETSIKLNENFLTDIIWKSLCCCSIDEENMLRISNKVMHPEQCLPKEICPITRILS